MRRENRGVLRGLQGRLPKLLFAFGLIAFVVIGASYNGAPAFAWNWCGWGGEPPIVTTNYGKVKGYNSEDTVVWKGVPFAKPPVADLRWKAPQDPEPWWGEVLDATKPCTPCTQLHTLPNWTREDYAIGSEDCLYLNIYRPRTCEKNLPVYVYFHGGSNNFGTAEDYDGSVIASKSNMVVVIAQYRLGPLGWLYHPALQNGDPETDSGNFGTLDNIKALEWIQENIRGFGGNPRNVTITGESAGAHNVMNLVISPLAKGLFHRAMSESGGMTTDPVGEEGDVPPLDTGVALANSTIEKLLVDDGTALDLTGARSIRESMTYEEIEAYLRGKTSYELYEVLYGSIGTYDAYQDGHVIPGSVVSTIRSGNYNKVPIILGANEYETKAFMPLYGPAFGLPWFGLIDVLEGNQTLDDVLPTPADKLLYQITGYYGSRNWRAKFVDERARALREQQGSVYAYLFKWGGNSNIGSGPSPFDFIYGAGHATEISFFFGSDTSLWGYGYNPDNDTAGRQKLSDAMMEYLANFTRTGNPNYAYWRRWHEKDHSDLPVWQSWHNMKGKPKVMEFDANFHVAILKMSNEEVTIPGVAAELGVAALSLPADVRALPWYFQWSAAEP
jgi:para-nitrobenzyl esterase